MKPVYLIMALLVPLSYCFEGLPYHKQISKELTRCPNYFKKDQLSSALASGVRFMDRKKYQAIIPLPFYHIGSENFGISGTDKIHRISMLLSYHSGIPLSGNYSTRTSIPESKNLMQLLSPDFYKKEIERDIVSNKPFLVIYSQEPLSDYENAVLSKCDKIFYHDEYSIYSITKDALFENSCWQEFQHFESIKGQLLPEDGFLTSGTEPNAVNIYNSYEESPQETAFRGSGSFRGEFRRYNLLETIEPGHLKPGIEYMLSFWMFNDGENYGQDALNSTAVIEEKDRAGKVEWISFINPAHSMVINGSWSLVELSFTLKNDSSTVSVILKGSKRSKKDFYVDDLLIREKNADVYRVFEDSRGQVFELFKNNHQIKLPLQ